MNQIDGSCLVQEPVTLQLVELTQVIASLIENNDQELQLVQYICPAFEQSAVVSKLFQEIAHSLHKQEEDELKSVIIDNSYSYANAFCQNFKTKT